MNKLFGTKRLRVLHPRAIGIYTSFMGRHSGRDCRNDGVQDLCRYLCPRAQVRTGSRNPKTFEYVLKELISLL